MSISILPSTCTVYLPPQHTQAPSKLKELQEDFEKIPFAFSHRDKVTASHQLQTFLHHYMQLGDDSACNEIRSSLLAKYPELQELVNCVTGSYKAGDIVNILYVLAGLKPMLVFEEGCKELSLRKLVIAFPHLTYTKLRGREYLINEHPHSDFDPRRFISDFDAKYGSIENAGVQAFENQDKSETDQLLSYIFGFGPTWEVYAANGRRRYLLQESEILFSDEHFYQLGKALNNNSTLSREQLVSRGKLYSAEILIKGAEGIQSKMLAVVPKEVGLGAYFMSQVADTLTVKTDYLQNGMAYRGHLLKLFGLLPG